MRPIHINNLIYTINIYKLNFKVLKLKVIFETWVGITLVIELSNDSIPKTRECGLRVGPSEDIIWKTRKLWNYFGRWVLTVWLCRCQPKKFWIFLDGEQNRRNYFKPTSNYQNHRRVIFWKVIASVRSYDNYGLQFWFKRSFSFDL